MKQEAAPIPNSGNRGCLFTVLAGIKSVKWGKKKKKGGNLVYIKYSLGFLIGSLIQAGIVILAEKTGISQMGAKLTFFQLILHILAGQIAGYVLLFIMRKVETIQQMNTFITGAIWGIIVWAIVVPLNAAQGKVKLPWEAGVGTVIASLFAFIVFGNIVTYTIRRYGEESKKAVV